MNAINSLSVHHPHRGVVKFVITAVTRRPVNRFDKSQMGDKVRVETLNVHADGNIDRSLCVNYLELPSPLSGIRVATAGGEDLTKLCLDAEHVRVCDESIERAVEAARLLSDLV